MHKKAIFTEKANRVLEKQALLVETDMAAKAFANHPRVISTIQKLKNAKNVKQVQSTIKRVKDVPSIRKTLESIKQLDEFGKSQYPNLRRAAIGAQFIGNTMPLYTPPPYGFAPVGKAMAATYLGTALHTKKYMTNPKYKRTVDTVVGLFPR